MTSDNVTIGCRKGWPPSLFIVGAQKAGTTFLADTLGQHPAVQLAVPKEPGFLAGQRHKGIAWYEQCFAGVTDKILLDASTSYSAAPLAWCQDLDCYSAPLEGVPERIRGMSQDAKFIYVVRQPARRTYSAYWHNVRAGHESRSFRRALEERSLYLRTSDYMSQLEKYLSYFEEDRIKVIVFEDLIKRPLDEIQACYRFIGIDEEFNPTLDQKNKSYVYKGSFQKLNLRFAKNGGITPLLKSVARFVPNKVVERIGGIVVDDIPPMTREDREYLDGYFRPMIDRLEIFIGRKIDTWNESN